MLAQQPKYPGSNLPEKGMVQAMLQTYLNKSPLRMKYKIKAANITTTNPNIIITILL